MEAIRLGLCLVACGSMLAGLAMAEFEGLLLASDRTIPWRSNYRDALEEARDVQGMVFLWFVEGRDGETPEREALNDLLVRALRGGHEEKFVAVRLTTDTPLQTPEDAPIRLLDHPAFAEMLGRPGIAIIDLRDESSPHFHRVVSVYPFVHGPISEPELTAMLRLPAGSLTQRTLVWAVRTHGEQPASASGESSPLLMEQAAAHSRHQASLDRQGHHQWEERFHWLNERLPEGLVPQEVCAESWPGQGLVEAARECVRSWRHSSGHWEAVRTQHPLFGYDMQRGASGIWYATGVFARQR